ncbi:MAG: carboxypeptidase M32 [Calothrix sp. SM1_5_4]|nr:carboxypeptidase M32 [Calothrix sp. SM1_5_4]
MNNSLTRLIERFHEISLLTDVREILAWDEAVIMPPGAGERRNQSMAELFDCDPKTLVRS